MVLLFRVHFLVEFDLPQLMFYLFNQVYHLICGLRLLWTASFSDINGVLAGVVKD